MLSGRVLGAYKLLEIMENIILTTGRYNAERR